MQKFPNDVDMHTWLNVAKINEVVFIRANLMDYSCY